jgi:hypothetical protein
MATFQNQRSIEAFKAENGNATLQVFRKANGNHYFKCGSAVGYVAKTAVADLLAKKVGDVQVVDCITDKGDKIPTICKKAAAALAEL